MKKLPILDNKIDEEFSFKSLSDFACPIYLDNNATTRIDDAAATEMFKALEKDYANPSGVHEAGKIAKKNVEEARKNVANFVGCKTEEIVFTSCATESITSVINSAITTQYPRNHFITCSTEHGATLNKLKEVEEKVRYKVSYLDVNRHGNFDIEQLKILFSNADSKVALVSLMAANNETGTIHKNINEAIELSHKYGALFHVDAVQVAGKLQLKPYIDAGTDFLSISAHKFHGPKGIGVLFIKNGIQFVPSILGGYQENNRRAGTENVPGIIALGVVAKKMPVITEVMEKLHHKFIHALLIRIPSCIINGGGVPGTINVGFKYIHREAMVAKLSHYGLYASVGSACAKGIQPSHVLLAMGVTQEYIHGSVRFSFSKYTTEEEVNRALDIIEKTYTELRAYSKGIMP